MTAALLRILSWLLALGNTGTLLVLTLVARSPTPCCCASVRRAFYRPAACHGSLELT